MYTVLLVDDELSVTISLKNDIPWSNLGVDNILVAHDGLQAEEIINSSHVDLLISDIRMPRMDGLELLERVRENHSGIHCILLTAYSEFDYAMQALKLGVDGFLMKPIQVQELTETVENTLENIYVKRENEGVLFRENILRRWLNGSISSDELGEKTVYLDINIYQSNYCVVAMKKKISSVSLSAFGEECIKLFAANLDATALWDNSGHFIILFGGSKIIHKDLESQISQFTDNYKISNLINIAIGEIVQGRDDMHISYQSACKLLNLNESGNSNISTSLQDGYNTIWNSVSINVDELSPVVRRAYQYINDNYTIGISIKDFCNKININAAYLGYLFKKETGMFFNDYLIIQRTEKAIDLLCNTGERISDIAEKTGYATTSHFITTFKKKTGLPPQKYRESYGGRE